MPVLENWCGYAAVGAGARAGKHRLPLLVGPGGRPPPKDLVSRVKRAVSRFDVKTIAEAYPKRFEYAQLARHPALVLIPYQVSVMSLFEYYRMCLPLFVPSKELLWSWHKKFKLLKERTWFGVHGRARRRSPLDRHANATRSGVFAFDPNDDFSDDAALAWLELTPTDARGSSPSRLDAPPPAAALRRLPRPGPPGAVALVAEHFEKHLVDYTPDANYGDPRGAFFGRPPPRDVRAPRRQLGLPHPATPGA